MMKRREIGVLRARSVGAMVAALVVVFSVASVRADAECVPRDFLTLELSRQVADPVATALSTAYPMLKVADGDVRFPDGTILPLGTERGLSARERIASPTIFEQFSDVYRWARPPK